MTVQTEDTRWQYATNGTTGPWTVGAYFLQDADLVVTYTDDTGADTVLTATADYTVSGAGDPSGGSVTTTTAYASGGFITIVNDPVPLQGTDYTETDSFPATSHERALDRLSMAVLRMREQLKRTLRFRDSDGETTALPLSDDFVGYYIGLGSGGEPTYLLPPTGTAGALASDLATNNNAAKGAGQVGRGSLLDYPEGTVGYKLGEVRSVQDYGAHPTKTATQNTTAFQAAIDAISTVGTVFIPAGSYSLNGQLTVPAGKTVSFIGQGKGTSIINGQLAAADSSKSVISYAGTLGSECKNVLIADLTINARFYGKGIKAVYCYPKLTIRDVVVWKPVDDGIYLEECWGASVYDAWIDGDNASVGNGINVVNANAVSLYNPRVYNMKNSVQSRGIYATSCESFSVFGGNIENCPRGIEVQLATTYNGPVNIEGVYFEPRAMQPWVAGTPNSHIYVNGDTTKRGAVRVANCLLQPGNSGVPIAFNGVTARNLAVLTVEGCVWQKAQYTVGGQGENVFCDCDATVGKVIQTGNYLVSTSLGNLNTIATDRLTVNNYNDDGTNDSALGPVISLLVRNTSTTTAQFYRDAIVGGSASISQLDFGARESASVYASGARIQALSDGAWTGTNHGTDVLFFTTANGSTTLTQRLQLEAGGTVQPGADNTQSLGTGAFRWKEVFAGTGTINTSDARAKEQFRSLDAAERAVALRIKDLIKAFKFSDAVALKGAGARWHVGVVAQEVAEAFNAEGLAPDSYAVFCYDEWPEQPAVLNEDGTVARAAVPAGNRYGIRYEELLAFIIASL